MSQPHRPGHAGLMASESSASGKLTGPLPWEALDDRSDEENSTAGNFVFCTISHKQADASLGSTKELLSLFMGRLEPSESFGMHPVASAGLWPWHSFAWLEGEVYILCSTSILRSDFLSRDAALRAGICNWRGGKCFAARPGWGCIC